MLSSGVLALLARTASRHAACSASFGVRAASNLPRGHEWKLLKLQGENINPCNSALHPSVRDANMKPEGAEEIPMQHAYGGESNCFGCGVKNSDGLQLQSYRINNGLIARVTLNKKYICFPGIVSGGIITTLFDCHGNWTAAIALMDRSKLPRPPLTLTSEILVNFKEPTPELTELVLRSQVVSVQDRLPRQDIRSDAKVISVRRGAKSQVQVDLSLSMLQPGNDEEPEKVLATATGIYKKMGALRAL